MTVAQMPLRVQERLLDQIDGSGNQPSLGIQSPTSLIPQILGQILSTQALLVRRQQRIFHSVHGYLVWPACCLDLCDMLEYRQPLQRA